MSNIQIQLFNNSILRLTKSLVIKDETMASNVNDSIEHLYAARGLSMKNLPLRQYKYYMNVAGMYHFTDSEMFVVSLDTMETIPFTIEALELHRGTRRQYREKGRYYEELVAKYPTQEALIRGVLHPVDLEHAIAAPNYTILQYSKNEIESQETDLITKLQSDIYKYTERWIVKDYEKVDKYYPIAQMMTLYMMIPKMVDTIRLGNCKTYRAHSFHIWNYLESHGRLGQYKDYMLISQAMWLYMNINWVYANVGKQDTFDKLVTEILTKRGIPIGQYKTAIDTTMIGPELRGQAFMKRTPINLLERVGDTEVDKSIEYLLVKQLPLARDNLLHHSEALTEATTVLSRDLISSHPTKVYESEMVDLSGRLYVTLEEVLLENWMYMSSKDLYVALINVQNPLTSDVMSMSVKDAFIMWLYVTNKTMGHTLTTIPDLIAYNVPAEVKPTYAQLRAITSERYVTTAQIEYLVNSSLVPGVTISTAAFYEYAKELHALMLHHRKYYSVVEHKDTRGQLEGLVQKLYTTIPCNLVSRPTTYVQFFEANGWEISELNEIDLAILADDLLKIATGLNLNDVTSISEIQKAMLSLMSRLSEYSSHFIQSINTSPATIADMVNVRVGDTWKHFSHSTRQNIGVHVEDHFTNVGLTTPTKLVSKINLDDRFYNHRLNSKIESTVGMNLEARRVYTSRLNIGAIRFN